MIRLFVSAALLLTAMSLTLLALFLFSHRGIAGTATHPHPGLSVSECPASPHGVSPRPTLSAKVVIRT